MMALDLDIWPQLSSREEVSFRNVYVSMLEGTKQLNKHKWCKKHQLETLFKTIL